MADNSRHQQHMSAPHGLGEKQTGRSLLTLARQCSQLYPLNLRNTTVLRECHGFLNSSAETLSLNGGSSYQQQPASSTHQEFTKERNSSRQNFLSLSPLAFYHIVSSKRESINCFFAGVDWVKNKLGTFYASWPHAAFFRIPNENMCQVDS